ncbi:MAG: AMP-binding protein [Defluviicoccus sp.]|nr:AMP-binding protein [Defluviicoccus sp.]MDE0278192.1 AMP-binding protein [Defluviicoccus sp.]
MNITGATAERAREACDRLSRSTVPEIFAERVAESGDAIALRYKEEGLYRELGWARYQARVKAVAAGLVSLGLARGDRLAIMGDPTVEYLLAHMASIFAAAMPFGIYPTSSPSEVAFQLRKGRARIVVAGDQEHLDKVLGAEATAGRRLVDRIVLIDCRTRFLYDDPRILPFVELEERGDADDKAARECEARISGLDAESPVGLIFTSGTTGDAKGAMFTHGGMLVGLGYCLFRAMPELAERPHRVVTHLPLAHGMGQGLSLFIPLFADVIQHIPERGQTLGALLREVRPTSLLGVPRIWQKFGSQISTAVEMSGGLRRRLFKLAERTGRERARRLWETRARHAGPFLELRYRLLHAVMIWPALYKTGMAHLVGGSSGGAPLPEGVQERWQAWGIPLRNFYGTTEAGVTSLQDAPWPRPEDPLQTIYPNEVIAGKDDEIIVAGPGSFSCYWEEPEETASVRAENGAVSTGDIAAFRADGGHLIVDRKKDILITSGGKNIAPALVENALKTSPYISEAIIFGDNRKYVTALIEIDFDTLSHWARTNDVPYTGFKSLVENDKVIGHVGGEITRANELLARPEQIKFFRILPKELDPEEGDTTPTRKVKRALAYEMFQHLVEDMYAEA